ncbi:MAG: thermonuclease family protein [Candidatus Omnitrophica bacterium]|nr:thermonuclease family protein [Candidatus Omnitrophota bacterium]
MATMAGMIWKEISNTFFKNVRRRSGRRLGRGGSPVKFLLTLLVAAAVGYLGYNRVIEGPSLRVVQVYDGDTIKLSNGEKVRLIGVDTPETHDNQKLFRDAERSGQDKEVIKAMGEESYHFTQDLVLGKNVQLEYDMERRDKYGRLLAYVWLEGNESQSSWPEYAVTQICKNEKGEEGQCLSLNATLLTAGYAQPMTIPPNTKYSDQYRRFYQQARDEGRGLWRE